jgi:A/G-specific adenine glycosylase
MTADPRTPEAIHGLWKRAGELVPKRRAGDFNSALMELGATVCTPRNPQCLICPVRADCEAQAAGAQEKVPVPKKAKPTPLLRRCTFCIQHEGRWLIEQRPPRGRWAGMWQFVTVDAAASKSANAPLPIKDARPLGAVTHGLTHRRYEFSVYIARAGEAAPLDGPPRRWVTLDELDAFPLPRPHLKIVRMIRDDVGGESQ